MAMSSSDETTYRVEALRAAIAVHSGPCAPIRRCCELETEITHTADVFLFWLRNGGRTAHINLVIGPAVDE